MPLVGLLPCGVVSVSMTGRSTTRQGEVRPDAALVYRDLQAPDRWLVGAPEHSVDAERAFTGPNACQRAIEFAHRHYGSARSFSD